MKTKEQFPFKARYAGREVVVLERHWIASELAMSPTDVDDLMVSVEDVRDFNFHMEYAITTMFTGRAMILPAL